MSGLWHSDTWTSCPAVLSIRLLPSLQIGEAALFSALADLRVLRKRSRRIRRKTDYSGFAVGTTPRERWDDALPLPDELNGGSYATRLESAFGAGEFFLLVNNFQEVIPQVYSSVCVEILDALRLKTFRDSPAIASVSTPATMTVVVSRSRRTPTGIHRDPNHAFLHPIVGTKTILAWPANRISESSPLIGSVDVDPILSRASRLHGTSDNVIFWPADWWHIAYERVPRVRASIVFCIEATNGVRRL